MIEPKARKGRESVKESAAAPRQPEISDLKFQISKGDPGTGRALEVQISN
jgi:hypothetical protein